MGFLVKFIFDLLIMLVIICIVLLKVYGRKNLLLSVCVYVLVFFLKNVMSYVFIRIIKCNFVEDFCEYLKVWV